MSNYTTARRSKAAKTWWAKKKRRDAALSKKLSAEDCRVLAAFFGFDSTQEFKDFALQQERKAHR